MYKKYQTKKVKGNLVYTDYYLISNSYFVSLFLFLTRAFIVLGLDSVSFVHVLLFFPRLFKFYLKLSFSLHDQHNYTTQSLLIN